MNKYDISDLVYFINKKEHRIDHGIIRKIIIENNKIDYDIELSIYYNHEHQIVEENVISKDLWKLYQQVKDNIEEYFPSPVRSMKDRVSKKEVKNELRLFEELTGFSLDVAFKALKEGIYVEGYNLNNLFEKHNVRGIELNGLGVISNICSCGDCDFTCYYKDYKKTWWLKEDKSE